MAQIIAHLHLHHLCHIEIGRVTKCYLVVVHSGNPPNTVAKLFMEYLAHFSFKKVVFAIIDNTLIGRTTSNYKIFQESFSRI